MNETEILKIVATQGIFALLFCYLLLYVLKENSKREEKYQDIIANLTDKFESIEQGLYCIKDDVKEVKNKMFK